MVTTIARPPVSNNPVSLPTYDKATLQQLQKDYGLSCSKYEQLAEKRLSRSDTIIISGVGCVLRVKNNALMDCVLTCMDRGWRPGKVVA